MGADLSSWPIFVITLQGDDDRRAELVEALEQIGLEYTLHFGVDGRRGLSETHEFLVDRTEAQRRHGRALTDTEFACSLSHREVYEIVLKNELEGALILEDDAIVDTRLADFVKKRAYLASDITMLDHSHARVWGKEILLPDASMARTLALPSCLNTAYSVSNAGCRHLFDSSSPVVSQADWPGDICSIGAIALLQQIVSHPDPLFGVSHLRRNRDQAGGQDNQIKRFFTFSFWRRWATKRLSARIS